MLLTAARELGIDLASSIMFGDKTSDLEAARVAGVPVRVLLGTDARELPAMPATAGLAGAVYRGLLDATADAALLAPPGSLTTASG
jgi:D-glycero-D-manno-heptose 1,7-bisphosphate phosphatase